jgi:6-pyruvoyltetrahydropterin/6-carboxytetrahydropterin synthase
MELRKTFRFEASHVLPKHPGKCSRLHGHSWVLHVFVEGPVEEMTGFVMDFGDISSFVKPLIDNLLDHYHLNDTTKIYPSSENLLIWIGRELYAYRWSKLALEETCTSYAELTRKEFDALHYKS